MIWNTEFSAWWIPLMALGAAAVSWWYYRGQSWLSDATRLVRWSLFSLRSIGLFLVLILLLGILYQGIRYRTEKPVLLFVMDRSSSLKNYQDSTQIREKLTQLKANFDRRFGEKYQVDAFGIGEELASWEPLVLRDQQTDLARGLEDLYSRYYNRNIGAVVLVSDGNYNTGINPLYAAEKFALTSFYTIGVGDTVQKKDQVVREVMSNEFAFLKSQFPIEVDIEAHKVGKSGAQVSLYWNDQLIDRKAVRYENGTYDYQQIQFLVEATQVGFQRYTVVVEHQANEVTYKNNRKTVYVEVLDGRQQVLILSNAPHPDMSVLKTVLEKNENTEVKALLWEDWDKNTQKVDLVIWHEPGNGFKPEHLALLDRAKIPVLFFIGPNTPNAVLQQLQIGMQMANTNQTDEVQARMNAGFALFETPGNLKQELNFYPPVKTRFGAVQLSPKNQVLLQQRIGSIEKKEPILFFGQNDVRKYGVFVGEGIWRWRMNEYVRSKSAPNFDAFIQQLSAYLAVKKQTSALRVTPPRRFTTSERVKIKAEFYNDALELITSPLISLEIKGSKGTSRIDFVPTANFYTADLGNLPAGTYQWKATTKHNGKAYQKSGEFVVETVALESLDTRADHSILRQIASLGDGRFASLAQAEKAWDHLENRPDLVDVSYEESTQRDLLDFVWLMILIATVFAAEWFLRRWNGGY